MLRQPPKLILLVRLAALAAALLAVAGGESRAQPTATAPRLAQALADPAVAQALLDIERYEGLAEKLSPGDKATGQRYLNELRPVFQRLSKVQDKSQPQWAEAANRFNALQKRIVEIANQPVAAGAAPTTPTAPPRLTSSDQARLNRTDRAIQSLAQDIERSDFQAFLEPDRLGKLKGTIASYREALAGFPAEIPEVAAAAKALDAAAVRLDQRTAEAQARVGAVGDIDSALAAIDARVRGDKVPPATAFEPEAGAEAAAVFAKTLTQLRHQSQSDLATIEKIAATGFKDERLSRLRHWAGVERQRQIDESANAAIQSMEGYLGNALQKAAFLADTDPNLADHRANRLLGAGRRNEVLKDLDAGLKAVETAKALDEGLERQSRPDRAAQAATLLAARKSYEEKHQQALGLSRMPAAGVTEERYLAIAKETLSRPEYKIGPYRRLVINSHQVQRKEKKEADIRATGATTATATIYHWVWDEYQVATAEPIGDQFYIFYNTLKLFHQGAPTTPLNRWVLSERIQGDLILEANIDR